MARTDPRPHYGTKRRVRDDGYVDIYEPDHPLARRDGYVFEHRKMAWDAGLLVDPTMEVHHLNELKTDNRLDNFEIKTGSQHALDHAEERGYVTNQFGSFTVKPQEERQSALYGEVRLTRPTEPCQHCGGVVQSSKRRDAQYCSKKCQLTAWRARNPNYRH